MSKQSIANIQGLTQTIFRFLNATTPYAVLRNYEQLPWRNSSRDIDIVIRKSDYKKVKCDLIEIIRKTGWQIIVYHKSDRLVTYVCGKIDGERVELIQWDFFFHTSVFGIRLMEPKEHLKERLFNGEIYHVSAVGEFLDKFLYVRAVRENYPAKYNEIKNKVAEETQVKSKLKELYACDSVGMAECVSGRKLLMRALWSNMKRSPVKQIRGICEFMFSYIRNYSYSNTGFSLGFTGPDGVGKTTVIETLHSKVSPVFDKATEFYHFRPSLLPNLGEAAHSVGIKKEVDREYSKPHRSNRKSYLSSLFRLYYYTIDYILGFWVKVKAHKRITKMIVFDRYYTDIIADSRRSCINLNMKFLYYWGKLFIPRMNYNILLTADADIILQRKQELDRQGIDSINKKLGYLKDKKGYYLVSNNHRPEQVVLEILNIVFSEQHKKNMKRIGK